MKTWQITEKQNNSTLEGNLDLSYDRVIELNKILGDTLDDPNIIKTTEIMRIILDKCINENEAAYILFCLGEKAGLTKAKSLIAKNPIDFLSCMMKENS